MKLRALAVLLCVTHLFAASAQVPVVPAPDHAALLASANPKLAENKRLVYDFWREVFEAGHMELAEKYMAENYIQYNPNVPTGRAAFIDFFSKVKKPRPIESKVAAPLVSITAEAIWWSCPLFERTQTQRTQPRSTRPLGSTCSASRTARSQSIGIQLSDNDPRRSEGLEPLLSGSHGAHALSVPLPRPGIRAGRNLRKTTLISRALRRADPSASLRAPLRKRLN